MITSMNDFLSAHPGLRYAYFGGKGGVGKTVMAGATALWLAEQGKKTLLASTNPVHSLSNLLNQNVFGKPTLVDQGAGLTALEIDTRDTIERSKTEIREKVNWFLKFADIPTKADDFVESATMNPAFEESAMFENMIDLIVQDEYEVYVFDTAPTANARRLLGMSKVYGLWVDKMLQSRKDAQDTRLKLSFRKQKQEEEDPLLTYLSGFRERIEKMRVLITDDTKTAFFFVTLLESLPIAVIKRFVGWFQDFGIPIGGVLVNEVIDEAQLDDNTTQFVLNRVQMQKKYMAEAEESFERILGTVPLLEREVKGVDMLRRVTRELFPAA
jgi:arsenite-transporting ATPase